MRKFFPGRDVGTSLYSSLLAADGLFLLGAAALAALGIVEVGPAPTSTLITAGAGGLAVAFGGLALFFNRDRK